MLFGLVALRTIPIQLAPDVNRPVITVQTLWPGAAPAEVERELVNRQEEQMAGLEGHRRWHRGNLAQPTEDRDVKQPSVQRKADAGRMSNENCYRS